MILAIDIGGTQYRLAAVDARGVIKRLVRGKTDAGAGASWMIEQIVGKGSRLCREWTFEACGIGFGGPVDFDEQRVISSTHVLGWDDLPLGEVIGDALGIPAVFDNDANLGALGELTFGAGRGCRHLVYYTISTGIGGGVILDGEIYRGAIGQAGELGHVPILIDGPVCACGNRGCLEALCSGPSIARRAMEALRSGARSPRLRETLREEDEVSAKDVAEAAEMGDSLGRALMRETVDYLSLGVAAAVNAFAPDRVVVGGGVARAGRILLDPLRTAVASRVMPVHRDLVHISRATRGDRSVLLGASALARRSL